VKMQYRPVFKDGEFKRNKMNYLLPNEEGKIIVYTYIRKNACSAFKLLMLERSRQQEGSEIEKMRAFRAPQHLKQWDHSVFVYRDPFERAVSVFQNKFLDKSGNGDIFYSFKAQTGKDPHTATFRDFVTYLKTPFEELDPHVWPQKSHLLEIEYTLPIDMNDLTNVIEEEFPSLSKFFQNKVNESRERADILGDLCDVPANQISNYNKKNFEALRPTLEDLYSSDMEMISEVKRQTSRQNSCK